MENFKLEIGGIQRAGFREASGLDEDSQAIESHEGTVESFAERKLPGLTKSSNITLKRGITDDHSLCNWRNKVVDGKTEAKNGSVVLTDESGAEKTRWNFVNGWPTKWTGPSFNANTSDVAVET
jgi:phage tail-like protein